MYIHAQRTNRTHIKTEKLETKKHAPNSLSAYGGLNTAIFQ